MKERVVLVILFTVVAFVLSQRIPCDDTTTARPPDATCPPETQGALGVSGFIESSTIQSCSKFDKSQIDCGDGNATVIVLGLIPGQQSPELSLNVITHHEQSEANGAKCSASVDGKCVTIEPITLTVSASDSVLTWSLQDTGIDTFYAYTHAFSGATTHADDDDTIDDSCGVVDRSNSRMSNYKDIEYYSATCFPFKMFDMDDDDSSVGMNVYPHVVDCRTTDYSSGILEKASEEYCTVPYPKTQEPTFALEKNLDAQSGMERLNLSVSYGEYRFPSFRENCKDNYLEQDDVDDEGCYIVCDEDDSDKSFVKLQERWNFFDADDTRLSCGNPRCFKKYGVLSDKQPCRVWAGNYFTQMPVQGSEIIMPSDIIVPEELADDLSDYFSTTPDGVLDANRRAVMADSLVSPRGLFNYANYVWQKRPICPGCPGPYGPHKHWLYPRKPNTDKGFKARDTNGVRSFPHHTQCYEDDDECCDAFIFQDVGKAEKEVPVAECKYTDDTEGTCPMRRGILDHDYSLGVRSQSDYYDASIDPDSILPPFLDANAFDLISEGLINLKRSLCEQTFGDDEICNVSQSSYITDDSLLWLGSIAASGIALTLFASSLALIFTGFAVTVAPFVIGAATAVAVVIAGIVIFFTNGAVVIPFTTSSAMGFMYPTCRAYDIREQPQLYINVDAKLEFSDRPDSDPIELSVGNLATVSKIAQTDEPTDFSTYGDTYNERDRDSSLDRSFFMRILNLDSTAQKIGQNLGGVITVCNATNNLIFEADQDDLTKNPWDSVPKKPHGIYTTMPGKTFGGDAQYGAINRQVNKCMGEGEECNEYSWWYMDRRESYGTGCGELGIEPGYFKSTFNQEAACRTPIQNCIPGLNPVTLAEELYTFEDRLSDRISGNNTERDLRDSMRIQTPCQMSGQLLDIEDLDDPNEIASRLNRQTNVHQPLPPNWVERDGSENNGGSGYSNPKYALHGTNLLYYGDFMRSESTNYIRVEIVIAGNVVEARESVSTGRFLFDTGVEADDPSCGLVVNGIGTFSVVVKNTGSQPSQFRVKGSCDDSDLLVSTVDLGTLQSDEVQRVNVRIDHVNTADTNVTSDINARPSCVLELVHPIYGITFDAIETRCTVSDATGDVQFVSPDLVGCVSWDDPECAADIRAGVEQEGAAQNLEWLFVLLVIVGLTLSAITILAVAQIVLKPWAAKGRAMKRSADASRAGLATDLSVALEKNQQL